MQIIIGTENATSIDGRHTILELDTFRINGNKPVTAYCVIDAVPITEMNTIDNYKKLHLELMENYRKKNWKFCEDALEHLQGRWKGEVDSFYIELFKRIQELKTQSLPDNWDGIILKNVAT